MRFQQTVSLRVLRSTEMGEVLAIASARVQLYISTGMDNNTGGRIFVPLYGKTSISLREGSTYQVIDANGTDANGASFQLPNPDPNNDGITEYSVWVRALGKPGGSSKTTTCATDVDGTLWCSVYTSVLVRSTGQSQFTDVSKELLYIYADINGDGKIERVPLFGQRAPELLLVVR